jgi:hypothetical protein
MDVVSPMVKALSAEKHFQKKCGWSLNLTMNLNTALRLSVRGGALSPKLIIWVVLLIINLDEVFATHNMRNFSERG